MEIIEHKTKAARRNVWREKTKRKGKGGVVYMSSQV